MRIAFDLESRQIVDPDALAGSIGTITVRRGEVLPMDVQLVRRGVKVEEPGGEVGVYLIEQGDYSSLLSSDLAVAGTGTGTETVFPATLDVNETAIDALFPSAATESATALLEVRVETSSNSYRSAPVEVTIQNSYTPA